MRALLVLAAVGALVGAIALLLGPLSADDPPPPRADRAPQQVDGPFSVAARAPDTSVDELAERLRIDAVLPRRAQHAARMSDLALARQMIRTTCAGTTRDCRQAVASAAIRRIWASMPRDGDPVRKAQRLLALGSRFALSPDAVRNTVRAELDEQLARAVAAGRIGERRRDDAIACFDAPGECALGRREG